MLYWLAVDKNNVCVVLLSTNADCMKYTFHNTFLPALPLWRALPLVCLCIYLCAGVLECGFGGAAHAAPPQRFSLGYLALAHEQDGLFVDIACTVDDEDGLRDLLKDGAILELSVDVRVERYRSLWKNSEVVRTVYTSTLRHDPLTREFILRMPGSDDKPPLRNRNLTRLLQASWRQMRLPLLDTEQLAALDASDEFTVFVVLDLHHTEAPPWLENSLVFGSFAVVPQVEYTLPLSLAPHEGR